MLLTKLSAAYDMKNAKEESWITRKNNEFYDFLKERNQEACLELDNLEERLESFVSWSHKQTKKSERPDDEEDPLQEGKKICDETSVFQNTVLHSDEMRCIMAARDFPQLLRYLPQLVPGFFLKVITMETKYLEKVNTLLEEHPGDMAFKELMKKHTGLLGFETSSEALVRSGLMGKVPEEERGAIYMYEYIKRDTRENGHTCVLCEKMMDALGPTVRTLEESLEFLNGCKITKTVVEGSRRLVYLMTLWKAEQKIAKGVDKLIRLNTEQPWELDVDFNSDEFESIRSDVDQLRAAHLISSKPVVVISGKGGCGKTYVVTKVITSAQANRQAKGSFYEQAGNIGMDDETQDMTDSEVTQGENEELSFRVGTCVDNSQGMGQDGDQDPGSGEDGVPEKVELLLTAPTGKAANLLGKRAKHPSFTLHQVIFSFRNMEPGQPWRHAEVNTLVVDECSLVAVTTFAFLVELLQKNARLRRVVLLGDVRQLPSIEPGNFLPDTFSSLDRIGCSVELRNNHRAESQLIVDNATLISKRQFPRFEKEKFVFRSLPENQPAKSGNDYMSQDILVEVQSLLEHEALGDHTTSQFISFTRKVCEAINDICCSKYSKHRIRDSKGKIDLQIGDKICCTKNGYVARYEDEGGTMSCHTQSQFDKKEEEDGGVQRFVSEDDPSDISTLPSQATPLHAKGHNSEQAPGKGDKSSKKRNEIRLCNGEIFFIMDEKVIIKDRNEFQTYLELWDGDKTGGLRFWADKKELKAKCKIQHAWARTIHTFQGSETDNVVYIVGSRTWRQNWQHVYTAVTRGRKTVFIVGQETNLRNAIKRQEIKRQTSLKKQIVDLFHKNKDVKGTMAPGTPVKSQIPANQILPGRSHAFQIHPINNFVTEAGSPKLNDTQMMTNVLTSLAHEHDEEDGLGEDIVEYDSDGSDSILTVIKPPQRPPASAQHKPSNKLSFNAQCDSVKNSGKSFKQIKQINHSVIPAEIETDLIKHSDESDADSDDSVSILATPELKKGMKNVGKHSGCENSHGNQVTLAQSPVTAKENVLSSESDETEEDIDADLFDSQSLISPHVKPNRTIISQRLSLKRSCHSTRVKYTNKEQNVIDMFSLAQNEINVHSNSHSKQDKCTSADQTPSCQKQAILFKSLIPWSRDEEGRGKNATSSPLADNAHSNAQFQFTPGLSSTFSTLERFRTGGFAKHSKFDRNIVSPIGRKQESPVLFESPPVLKTGRNSALFDIQDPKSNESMQSQWSDVDESDFLKFGDESHIQSVSATGNELYLDVNNRKGESEASRTIANHLHKQQCTNTSQWSEVEDEQYMTLNLEDIHHMTLPGSHCAAGEDVPLSPASNWTSRSSISPAHTSACTTPDTSSSTSRSLGSTPRKRKHSGHDEVDAVSVSPLKRTLEQLSMSP
ncbi:DNA helicase B-like isoform X2 [Mya arenaria]|nr:DNA helicase B-like isoform X2 [Mya arenaria]